MAKMQVSKFKEYITEAKEALNLLSDDQIENIKLGLKKGGRKNK